MAKHEDSLTKLRRRAEEANRELLPVAAILSPDTGQKLLHELQVHQIELELQNEELRRVQDELQAARTKYIYLYDFAPVGYFTLDQTGVIEEVNLAGAALIGRGKTAAHLLLLFGHGIP